MINLKHLITEQSMLSKLFGKDSEEQTVTDDSKPNILFIGDSYIKSNNNYVKKLFDSKAVSGKRVISSKITLKKLLSIIKRISFTEYDMVCITFGYMFNSEKTEADGIKALDDIFKYLDERGTDIIIVNGIPGKTKVSNNLINYVANTSTSAVIIDTPSPINDQTKLLTNWVEAVNSEFNLKITTAAADSDSETPDGSDDDSSSGDVKLIPLSNIDINADVVDQAIELLKHFEAFSSKPYWDVSNWRIGYGSSTITRKGGEVIRLSANRSSKPTETVTEEEALLDLNRRLNNEFIPATKRAIGNVTLPNNVLAALTSVVYNYGHLPSTVKAAVKEKPMSIESIATAVRNLSANKRRRGEEADHILQTTQNSPSNNVVASSQHSASGPFAINSHYGPRWGKMHRGTDYRATSGTTIYIVKPGKVIFAGNRNPTGWGNMVEVEHEDGYTTRYAHMSRLDVSTGDDVPAGTMIGLSGGNAGDPGAGNSKGAHLHWELVPAGSTKGINGEDVADTYFAFSKPSISLTTTDDKDKNPLKLTSILNSIL